MDLIKAAEEMKAFIGSYTNTDRIDLKGSILNQDFLDAYSDVDMEIYLNDSSTVDMKGLIKALNQQFGTVFGYEIHSHESQDVLRICLANMLRFDLTFVYPGAKKPCPTNSAAPDAIDSVVNQFWFMSAMVLAKLGRRDYLIAAHLALELCQLIIVVQMLHRDAEKGTNVHRFGDGEDVPVLRSLVRLGNDNAPVEGSTRDDILSALFNAAECMDKMCLRLGMDYAAKCTELKTAYFESHGR